MALTERLALLISADPRAAVRGLGDVGTAADKNLGKTEKRMDAVGKKMSTAGVGMIALGSAALLGLGKAAQASEEAQKSVLKLENSIRNSAVLAGHSAKEFTDLADAIQDKTAADADAIVEAEAFLAQSNKTADQIKELTPLVVDLARKTGMDYTAAAKLAVKSADGQTGALKRAGIQVDENLAKTDAYTATVEALRSSVGGFAEDEGKTFAGSVERMKNQLGDLVEGVGAGAVDAFTSMLDAVDPLVDKFNEMDPAMQGLIGKTAAFGATGLIAAGALSSMAGWLIKVRGQIKAAQAATATYIAATGGLKVALMGLQGLGIGAAVIIGTKLWSDAMAEADSRAKTLGQTIRKDLAGASLGELRDKLAATDEQIARLSSEKAGSQAPWDADKRAEIGKGIKELEKFRGEVANQIEAADALAAKTGMSSEAALELVRNTKDAATQEKILSGEFDATTDSIALQVEALNALSDELRAAFDPVFAMQSALRSEADARKALADAQREHGRSSDEAREAEQRLAEALVQTDSAAIGLTASVADGSVSLDEMRARLDEWVESGRLTETQADRIATEIMAATEAGRDYAGTYDATLTLNTDPAYQKLSSFVNSAGFQTFTGLLGFAPVQLDGARAAGGPVSGGGTYLVGEKGPELLHMGGNGYVQPNTAMGGPSMVVLNVDGYELARVLVGKMSQMGTLPIRVEESRR